MYKTTQKIHLKTACTGRKKALGFRLMTVGEGFLLSDVFLLHASSAFELDLDSVVVHDDAFDQCPHECDIARSFYFTCCQCLLEGVEPRFCFGVSHRRVLQFLLL